MRHPAILSVVLLAHCVASSQESSRPAFEVASVRAVKETEHAEGLHSTGNVPAFTGDMAQLSYPEASLTGLLSRAYDVVPLRVIAPDWMRSQRYSVTAKIPSGTTKEMLPLMLQNLLADRFQLKVHWETREESGYALTIAKGGPKLKQSAVDAQRGSSMSSAGRFSWQGSNLDDVAISLSIMMSRPVVDMTLLSGRFDITIEAAPDSIPGFHFRQGKESSFPTIFAALHDLGLTLEARKVSVKYLVVDSVLKIPTEN
jgi:uncharacterized protein (TIGR03435 family)